MADKEKRKNVIIAEEEENLNYGTPIYMRDLAKDKQTDSFLGKGTEDLIKEAEEKECNIVVGRFYKKAMLEE